MARTKETYRKANKPVPKNAKPKTKLQLNRYHGIYSEYK